MFQSRHPPCRSRLLPMMPLQTSNTLALTHTHTHTCTGTYPAVPRISSFPHLLPFPSHHPLPLELLLTCWRYGDWLDGARLSLPLSQSLPFRVSAAGRHMAVVSPREPFSQLPGLDVPGSQGIMLRSTSVDPRGCVYTWVLHIPRAAWLKMTSSERGKCLSLSRSLCSSSVSRRNGAAALHLSHTALRPPTAAPDQWGDDV